MKIDLPTENWNDIFGFLPRPQLAELVPQIGDRHFAEKAQFYLHECGKIILGHIRIKPPEDGNENGSPIVEKGGHWNWETPLAVVPMPSNIKNFKKITLSSFDESVITFLKEFQSNSLLTNVNLSFREFDSDTLSTFLTEILPLFDSITSITVRHADVLTLLRNQYSQNATSMLRSVRFLVVWNYAGHRWYLDWLYSQSKDGKPRVLTLFPKRKTHHSSISSFIEHVRKNFLDSNHTLCFFFRIFISGINYANLQARVLTNSKTKEKLVTGRDSDELGNYVTISRYPVGTTAKWINEMTQGSGSDDDGYKNIEIDI